MKGYKILFVCCIISVNAMEIVPQNDQFEKQILSDLKDSKISLMNKHVLDLCCGDGKFSFLMAQKVGQQDINNKCVVLGIDVSKDTINLARKKYVGQKNLSFYESAIAEFNVGKVTLLGYDLGQPALLFNVATLFNSFDLLTDQLSVCKKAYEYLKPGGDFLVNVGPGKESLDVQVSREMIDRIPLMSTMLFSFGIESVFQSSYSTEQKYREIFQEAGFDIVSLVKKQRCLIFKDKDEFALLKRPIAQNRPIVKSIPSWIFEYAFNKFIEQFLTHLQTNDAGQLVYTFDEILIHARKPDKK